MSSASLPSVPAESPIATDLPASLLELLRPGLSPIALGFAAIAPAADPVAAFDDEDDEDEDDDDFDDDDEEDEDDDDFDDEFDDDDEDDDDFEDEDDED